MSQKHIRHLTGFGPRIWTRIYYPQIHTLLMCLAYASLAYGWATALANQPSSFEGTSGQAAMWIVSLMILVGSLVGVPTALVGRHQVEKTAVLMVGAGLLMYALITYGLHISSEAGNRLPQAHTIIFAAIMFPIRYWWLIWYQKLLKEGFPASRDRPNTDL